MLPAGTSRKAVAAGRPTGLAGELGKSGPFESSEQEAYLNLMRTCSTLSAAFDRLFTEHGLSQPLYNVLRIVAGHGKCGVPSQTIARQLVSRGPDVTRLVDRLIQAGLVERKRCERDRRVVYVILTGAGRDKLARLRPAVDALHVRQLAHLGPAKLQRLSRLLVEARRHEPAPAEA